jgi:hypothetical protein
MRLHLPESRDLALRSTQIQLKSLRCSPFASAYVSKS